VASIGKFRLSGPFIMAIGGFLLGLVIWPLWSLTDWRSPISDVFNEPEPLYERLLQGASPILNEADSLRVAPLFIERLPAEDLEQRLREKPALRRGVLSALGAAYAKADRPLADRLGRYLADVAAAACFRQQKTDMPWRAQDIRALTELILVDPSRFMRDASFRSRIMAIVPDMAPAGISFKLRDQILVELNRVPGMDFNIVENFEWQWCSVPRLSREREMPYTSSGRWRFAEGAGAIETSFYSLPSAFFTFDQAETFLRGVRQLDSRRAVVVLSDLNQDFPFKNLCDSLGIHLIETHGREYSPWLRDPISFFRDGDGGLVILQRPNIQVQREEDFTIGREIIQGLPNRLDQRYGGVHWSTAETAFHNGKILLTPAKVWIALDALEVRILDIIGLDSIPVESFQSEAGLARFAEAIKQAVEEMERLFHRPVHFVHPKAEDGDLARRREALMLAGGLFGYDLDSLMALMPRDEGYVAWVADLQPGDALVAKTAKADLDAFIEQMGFRPDSEAFRRETLAYHGEDEARALDRSLDWVAEHLAKNEGMTVIRLPLVLVPPRLIQNQARYGDADNVVVTWTNVVFNQTASGDRAEGFSSLLPEGDRIAREAFERGGCRLDLLPPLVDSIMLGGGYRCASKHLRR